MSNRNQKPGNRSRKNQRAKQPSKPIKKPVKSTESKSSNPVIQDLSNLVKSVDVRQLVIKNLAFIITGIILWYVSPQITFIPFPSWVTGIIAGVGLKLMVYVKGKNAKKWRKDIEYGSARWGTGKDIKPFIDPDPKNNVILTKTESLTMNPRPKPVKYARNKNVLVIGGSGSGKTRFYVKPNIMQCESEDYPVSFCVTDPKGQILVEMGHFLEKRMGYTIKILNT
ncbi:MAG: hypothetical protein LBU66_04200, partial [Treponema sp.]|nr:hypothetical protein [Treponema sp.]